VSGTEELDILTMVLKGFIAQAAPNPLVITEDNAEPLAGGLLQVLDFHGWNLAYDEEKTKANIRAITAEVTKRMGSKPMGSSVVRPPELHNR
jgi:hypothetical protein